MPEAGGKGQAQSLQVQTLKQLAESAGPLATQKLRVSDVLVQQWSVEREYGV